MGLAFASASSQYLHNAAAVLAAEPITIACWANAATISASAASRSSSSGQFRIRRRCTDWYGMRWRNISDGNWTTFFRSRWIK